MFFLVLLRATGTLTCVQAWRARKSRALLLLGQTETEEATDASRPPNIAQASMKKREK